MPTRRRTLGVPLLLLLLSITLIGVIVFPWRSLTDHTHWEKVGWIPFVSPPIRVRDIVANVLLFVPVGVAAAIVWRRGMVLAGVLAFVLSLAGESTQLYSHPRFPSVTDLVCNVSGALIGAAVTRRKTKPA